MKPQELRTLRSALLDLSDDERAEALLSLTPAEAESLMYTWAFWARNEQLPPPGFWRTWLALAGRGWGKTRTGAEWINTEAERFPFTRMALVGRIPKDTRNVMVEGESGILACARPDFMPEWNQSLGILTYPNGTRAWTFSSEVPDDLRGPQFHRVWIDEWAKFRWPEALWDAVQFSTRIKREGDRSQVLVTTTPRPLKILKEVLAQTSTVTTGGSMYDNRENLDDGFLEEMNKYAKTSLGAQEIFARILDDAQGALWNRALLDTCRVTVRPEKLVKVVLAVDPSVTTTERSDETGMIRVGMDADAHGYALDDYTKPGGVDKHAKFIVGLWKSGLVDEVIAETNNGGDLVEATLRAVRDDETGEQIGKFLPFRKVTASRAKRTRAEPVRVMYEQKRFHHVGLLAELEDQLCTWEPTAGQSSPDRLDALVWGATALLLNKPAELKVRRFGK